MPAVVAAIVLFATRRRFPLTRLAYVLILAHCIILMVGGHYTYAEVPAGDWFRDLFDPPRNNYDKLGHLAQGFVPAIVAREVTIRLRVFNVLGQHVVTLVDGEVQAGRHRATFDASRLASGVYFFRMEAGPFVETKTMILAK